MLFYINECIIIIIIIVVVPVTPFPVWGLALALGALVTFYTSLVSCHGDGYYIPKFEFCLDKKSHGHQIGKKIVHLIATEFTLQCHCCTYSPTQHLNNTLNVNVSMWEWTIYLVHWLNPCWQLTGTIIKILSFRQILSTYLYCEKCCAL